MTSSGAGYKLAVGYTAFYDTADDAFVDLYKMLNEQGKSQGSRDGDVRGEIIGAHIVIRDITKCFMKNDVRQMSERYAIGEALWYLAADNGLKGIQNYTSAWDRMSDDGETVNSNYGWCIRRKFGFDQWEYVKNLIRKDQMTRQAVIHIKTADNAETKDMNCTVALQFLVRDGKLNMITTMRSNDLWMGFPFDVFQFTCMQQLMAIELGLGFGEYVHNVGSLHLYERHADYPNGGEE